jgi:hypothetical protein
LFLFLLTYSNYFFILAGENTFIIEDLAKTHIIAKKYIDW